MCCARIPMVEYMGTNVLTHTPEEMARRPELLQQLLQRPSDEFGMAFMNILVPCSDVVKQIFPPIDSASGKSKSEDDRDVSTPLHRHARELQWTQQEDEVGKTKAATSRAIYHQETCITPSLFMSQAFMMLSLVYNNFLEPATEALSKRNWEFVAEHTAERNLLSDLTEVEEEDEEVEEEEEEERATMRQVPAISPESEDSLVQYIDQAWHWIQWSWDQIPPVGQTQLMTHRGVYGLDNITKDVPRWIRCQSADPALLTKYIVMMIQMQAEIEKSRSHETGRLNETVLNHLCVFTQFVFTLSQSTALDAWLCPKSMTLIQQMENDIAPSVHDMTPQTLADQYYWFRQDLLRMAMFYSIEAVVIYVESMIADSSRTEKQRKQKQALLTLNYPMEEAKDTRTRMFHVKQVLTVLHTQYQKLLDQRRKMMRYVSRIPSWFRHAMEDESIPMQFPQIIESMPRMPTGTWFTEEHHTWDIILQTPANVFLLMAFKVIPAPTDCKIRTFFRSIRTIHSELDEIELSPNWFPTSHRGNIRE